jgi:1,4-dihydroxy-2-naphthoyl-CoA hydrolase
MSEVPGFDAALGTQYLEVTPDKVVAQFTLTERHLQPFGLPHGGVYCSVHEAVASVAGQAWLGTRGVIVGTNNSTDFLRQAKVGDVITTTATPIHRGRTQQLWHLDSVRADGKLISQGQVRLANLDQPIPEDKVAAFLGQMPGSDS